jgi:hypothetical protein
MSIFTTRNNGFLLLALVVLLGWYLLGFKESADTSDKNMEVAKVENSSEMSNTVTPAASTSSVEKKTVKPTVNAEQVYDDIRVPEETEELISWREERGYPDDANSYDGYDEGTLNSLADSGDIRAIHKLAEHYANLENPSDADKAVVSALYRDAALHGSTFAFLHLGIQQETAYANLSADDSRRHETAIEILATYNVAALRGDKMPNIARGKSFVAQNNIQLTDEDKQLIQTRSQDIYNNLARHRYALSLEEFDNEVPESVAQYFSEVEAVQEKVNQRRQQQ